MRISVFLLVGAVSLTACGGSDGTGIPPLESPPATRAAAYYSWMHPDVERAWGDGFLGQGARITVVDDFRNRDSAGADLRLRGDLRNKRERASHGRWVEVQAGLVAPESEILSFDYNNRNQRIELSGSGLDIVNLSFGLISPSRNYSELNREALAASVLAAARETSAVIVKAAGNAAVGEQPVSVDSSFQSSIDGTPTVVSDILNLALIGAESTIFVGALARNGTVENPTVLAEYSFVAGDNVTIQNQFLTVGVDSARMGGLAGTSFAAPIVSGYAAILGSKFEDATPRQIAGQLLNTAREDTIRGFDPALHGRGEASLGRALAPDRIH